MLRELSLLEFEEFSIIHPLKSYHQTSSYALFMANYEYQYKLLGLVDANNVVIAATMLLIKKIDNEYSYGYAPKGFLLDFSNEPLLKQFTEEIFKYCEKSKIVFVKINPEIAIGEVDQKNDFKVRYNINVKFVENLTKLGYVQCKPKYDFDTMLPRYNAFVNLKTLDLFNVEKNIRNKVVKGDRKGLKLEISNRDDITIFYDFIKHKKCKDLKYYQEYYNEFDKNKNIDLFLLKVDYTQFLIKAQERYEEELEHNNQINQDLIGKNNKRLINAKMASDRIINAIKNDINFASNKIRTKKEDIIGGALVIKYANRIYFVRTGYDKKFATMNPNHFMHYKIMEYYKNDNSFADLNGINGGFVKTGNYIGLNKFKLGFHPRVFEMIGEFDLVINKDYYNKLDNKGYLSKEFYTKIE